MLAVAATAAGGSVVARWPRGAAAAIAVFQLLF